MRLVVVDIVDVVDVVDVVGESSQLHLEWWWREASQELALGGEVHIQLHHHHHHHHHHHTATTLPGEGYCSPAATHTALSSAGISEHRSGGISQSHLATEEEDFTLHNLHTQHISAESDL